MPSFSPATNFSVGDYPLAVATGHLNNDDHPDLVTANNADGTVSVRLGNGLGGFGGEQVFPADLYPEYLAVGDIDGDGHNDLAMVQSGNWGVSVLLGNGDGTFEPPINVALNSGEATSLAVGDFDADGKMDLAVGTTFYYGYYSGGGWNDANVEVLLGYSRENGFATQTWTYLGYGTIGGLAVGDFGGDGYDDVAATLPYESSISVLLGTASGMVSGGAYSLGNSPWEIAAADITGDGVTDLVTTGSQLNTFRGNGNGSFTWIQSTSGGPSGRIAAADLNGDDTADLLAVNQSAGKVDTYLSVEGGTFVLSGSHGAGNAPFAIASADFNGDGRPDAATANYGSNDVSVLLNDGDWPSLDWRLSIGDVSITEGIPGTFVASFVVTLSTPSSDDVTVQYATSNGTATAGSDYQSTSGTLTIPAGQTSGRINVPILGDRLPESNETFTVLLSNPSNAILIDGLGTATILDDEPRISITDVSLLEGKKGKKTLFVFEVKLSTTYDQPITMSYRTLNGTAASGSDYTGKTGTLTFAPGETTKTITIEVKGDSKREANEYFYVDLYGNSSNSVFTKNRGLGTIRNDD